MGLIFGIVMGITSGVGIAFLITVLLVKKSNDIGDSHAVMSDVSCGICINEKEDNLHSMSRY